MPRIIPAISESEPALTPAEACQFLGGVTRRTLDTYSAGLRRYAIGGRVYYLQSDLRAFVRSRTPAADLTPRPAPKAAIDFLKRSGFKV